MKTNKTSIASRLASVVFCPVQAPLKFALFLPAILFSSSVFCHATNLVLNGNFSVAGTYSSPGVTPPVIADWTYYVADSTNDTSSYETSGGATGGPSAQLSTSGTNYGNETRSLTSTAFTVIPNAPYSVSFDYASDAGSSYYGSVTWLNASSAVVSVTTFTLSANSSIFGPTWSLYTQQVTAPAGAVSATFQFGSNTINSGFFDVDNVDIEKLSQNVVLNGNFSATGTYSSPGVTPPVIADWTYYVADSTNDTSSYETSGGATGGAYAQLSTSGTNYGNETRSLTSTPFAVTPSALYNVSFAYASDAGSGYYGSITWLGVGSTVLSVTDFNLSANSNIFGPTWSVYTQQLVAPAGAVSATFQFGSSTINSGFFDVDNVDIEKVSQNLVLNGNFSATGAYSSPGVTPPVVADWTYYVADSYNDTSSYQTSGGAGVADGPYVALGTSGTNWGNETRSVTSTAFAVTAGASYNVSFDYASDASGSYSGSINWLASNSSIISTTTYALSANSSIFGPTWALYQAQVTAPAGAVSATFQFGSSTINSGFFDVDNVDIEPVPATAGTTAVSADAFLNSIGVDTHITQGHDNPTNVATCLTYAGIRNIRDDHTLTPATLQSFISLHQSTGAMVCLLPFDVDSTDAQNIADSLSEYEQLNAAGALLAVEGPNEPENFPFEYGGLSSDGTQLTTTSVAQITNSAYYNGSYNNDSQAGAVSYGPVGFTYGSSTPFVTGEIVGPLRNNFTGWVGFNLTVGSSPITVNQLGRWVVSGNMGSHTVELVQVSNGAVLGSVSVNTSGATAGAFKYVSLGTSVQLAANTAYYVLSQETSGGDQWATCAYNATPVAEFQRDLYSAVKGDSKLTGIPVFDSSQASAPELTNVGLQYLTIPTPLPTGVLFPAGTEFADFATCHNYVCGNTGAALGDNQVWNAESTTYNQTYYAGLNVEYGYLWASGFTGYSNQQLATLPRVTTETGWPTGTSGNLLTQDQQGKVFLNLYLTAYKEDWGLTCIYYLHDSGTDTWGLFDTNYNAKLSGTYLHNMTTILADTTSFTPGSLNYSIPNEATTPTVHDLLIQKSNGKFELAVWDDRPTSDAASDPITVNLGSTYGTVNVYDPTVGTSATQTLTNVSSVSVTLSDHPLIIEIP